MAASAHLYHGIPVDNLDETRHLNALVPNSPHQTVKTFRLREPPRCDSDPDRLLQSRLAVTRQPRCPRTHSIQVTSTLDHLGATVEEAEGIVTRFRHRWRTAATCISVDMAWDISNTIRLLRHTHLRDCMIRCKRNTCTLRSMGEEHRRHLPYHKPLYRVWIRCDSMSLARLIICVSINSRLMFLGGILLQHAEPRDGLLPPTTGKTPLAPSTLLIPYRWTRKAGLTSP